MATFYPKWDNGYAYQLINYFGINPKEHFEILKRPSKPFNWELLDWQAALI